MRALLPRLLVPILMLAAFVSGLQPVILSPLLPAIARAFGVSPAAAGQLAAAACPHLRRDGAARRAPDRPLRPPYHPARRGGDPARGHPPLRPCPGPWLALRGTHRRRRRQRAHPPHEPRGGGRSLRRPGAAQSGGGADHRCRLGGGRPRLAGACPTRRPCRLARGTGCRGGARRRDRSSAPAGSPRPPSRTETSAAGAPMDGGIARCSPIGRRSGSSAPPCSLARAGRGGSSTSAPTRSPPSRRARPS